MGKFSNKNAQVWGIRFSLNHWTPSNRLWISSSHRTPALKPKLLSFSSIQSEGSFRRLSPRNWMSRCINYALVSLYYRNMQNLWQITETKEIIDSFIVFQLPSVMVIMLSDGTTVVFYTDHIMIKVILSHVSHVSHVCFGIRYDYEMVVMENTMIRPWWLWLFLWGINISYPTNLVK